MRRAGAAEDSEGIVSNLDLEAIKTRYAAAPSGPWEADRANPGMVWAWIEDRKTMRHMLDICSRFPCDEFAAASFIAAARADIPALVKEVERLRARTAAVCECALRGRWAGSPTGYVPCPSDRSPGDALCPRNCECRGYGFKLCQVCGGTGAVIVEAKP